MKHAGSVNTVMRLIALRRERLDQYRQDLVRLDAIVHDRTASLKLAQDTENHFLDETRQNERNNQCLNAALMVEHRRYLGHLRQCCMDEQKKFDDTILQRDQARRELEQAYAEIHTLERLAERKRVRILTEQQRQDYLMADDLEIIRRHNARSEYVRY